MDKDDLSAILTPESEILMPGILTPEVVSARALLRRDAIEARSQSVGPAAGESAADDEETASLIDGRSPSK